MFGSFLYSFSWLAPACQAMSLGREALQGSVQGWAEATRWPLLEEDRHEGFGCGKLGRKVIVAGPYYTITEVLDLDTRQLRRGMEMTSRRFGFHITTLLLPGGEEKVYAVAGARLDTVEEWVEETRRWVPANNVLEQRRWFGAVTLSKRLICPV